MAKRVFLDCFLTLGGTDRKSQFSSFDTKPLREAVDVGALGDKSEKYELGLFSATIGGNVRPEADWAFLKYLLQRMEDGADVAFVYRPVNSSKAATNPELSGNFKVDKVPPLGGERGRLFGEGSIEFKVNGAVTWDDGTTVLTLG